MGKVKTSAKQSASSTAKHPTRKLKRGAKVEDHRPTENLKDKQLIARAVAECIVDGDLEALKEVMRAHYEAVNISATLERIGISKRTFYDAIAPNGNPRIKTVMKMFGGLKQA